MQKLKMVVAFSALLGTSCSDQSKPLTKDQIAREYVGHTFSSTSGARARVNTDGTVIVLSKTPPVEGTWRLDGDQFCQTFDEKEHCFRLWKLADGRIKVSNGSVLTKE